MSERWDKLAEAIARGRVYEDKHAPLTRTKSDGRVVDVMCTVIDGNALVHPDRMPLMRTLIEAYHAAAKR